MVRNQRTIRIQNYFGPATVRSYLIVLIIELDMVFSFLEIPSLSNELTHLNYRSVFDGPSSYGKES